jgi:hypothetical protein
LLAYPARVDPESVLVTTRKCPDEHQVSLGGIVKLADFVVIEDGIVEFYPGRIPVNVMLKLREVSDPEIFDFIGHRADPVCKERPARWHDRLVVWAPANMADLAGLSLKTKLYLQVPTGYVYTPLLKQSQEKKAGDTK